jgi:hypothetical protein
LKPHPALTKEPVWCFVLTQSVDLVPGDEYQLAILDSVGDGMRSVGLFPGDEYQLAILDFVGDGMRCGYGGRSGSLYPTVDDANMIIMSSNVVPVIGSAKIM